MDRIRVCRKYKEMMLFFHRDERIEEKILSTEELTMEAIRFPDYCATTINKVI